MSREATLVRFGELGLKGANRPQFEKTLRRNIRRTLQGWPEARVSSLRGRLLVEHPAPAEELREDLRKVCGIQTLSPVLVAGETPEEVEQTAQEVFRAMRRRQPAARTFCVRVRRADKRFPIASIDMERRLGAALGQAHPDLQVKLQHPDLELGVDLRPEGNYVFGESIPGPGGLPVGSTGRALALLSGGIDSPVAAYLAMKRGLSLALVFFHAQEFTGEGPHRKVRKLAQILAAYQPRTRLYVVPFGAIQVVIKEHMDEPYRNVLYRRAMHRIAERLAGDLGATALVSGDALGQVASQTLENLALTAEATSLPLLRPLLTYDKEETVELARRIGTFDTSIEPEPDCCTLFQPAHPKVRGVPEEVQENEARVDLEEPIGAALAGVTVHQYSAGRPPAAANTGG